MVGTIILMGLMIAGYFFLRRKILAGVTDRVTKRNRRVLGRYLLILMGLFVLLLLWIAASCHS
jgi:hypothetical protein